MSSEEDRKVLRQQNILVKDDFAAGDLPIPLALSQYIRSPTDKRIGLVLDAILVDEEAAPPRCGAQKKLASVTSFDRRL